MPKIVVIHEGIDISAARLVVHAPPSQTKLTSHIFRIYLVGRHWKNADYIINSSSSIKSNNVMTS